MLAANVPTRTISSMPAAAGAEDWARRTSKIAYTFGVAPLQLYSITLPGGRLPALSIAGR